MVGLGAFNSLMVAGILSSTPHSTSTPTSHARAHSAKKCQHSPREHHDLSGLRYRPPQPARIVSRPSWWACPLP